jgi:hypothetical protein
MWLVLYNINPLSGWQLSPAYFNSEKKWIFFEKKMLKGNEYFTYLHLSPAYFNSEKKWIFFEKMLKGNEYFTYLHLSPAESKVDRWKEKIRN